MEVAASVAALGIAAATREEEGITAAAVVVGVV